MDVTPTSWHSLDWNNIDVYDARYYQSLYFALLERYFYQDYTPRRDGDLPAGIHDWGEDDIIVRNNYPYQIDNLIGGGGFAQGIMPRAINCERLVQALKETSNRRLYVYERINHARVNDNDVKYFHMGFAQVYYLPSLLTNVTVNRLNFYYHYMDDLFNANSLFGDNYSGLMFPHAGALIDVDNTRQWLTGMKDAINRLRYATLPCCRLYYHKAVNRTPIPNYPNVVHDFSDVIAYAKSQLADNGVYSAVNLQIRSIATQSAIYTVSKTQSSSGDHYVYRVGFERIDLRWKNYTSGTVEVYGYAFVDTKVKVGNLSFNNPSFYDFGLGFSEGELRHLASVPAGGTFEGVFNDDAYAIPPIGVNSTVEGNYDYNLSVALVADFNDVFKFKA